MEWGSVDAAAGAAGDSHAVDAGVVAAGHWGDKVGAPQPKAGEPRGKVGSAESSAAAAAAAARVQGPLGAPASVAAAVAIGLQRSLQPHRRHPQRQVPRFPNEVAAGEAEADEADEADEAVGALAVGAAQAQTRETCLQGNTAKGSHQRPDNGTRMAITGRGGLLPVPFHCCELTLRQ